MFLLEGISVISVKPANEPSPCFTLYPRYSRSPPCSLVSTGRADPCRDARGHLHGERHAVASTINQNTSWTINRTGATTSTAWWPTATPSSPATTAALQRGQARRAARRRRVPGHSVERQHRGRPPHQVRRQGRRHLQQQDHLREVVHAGDEHPRRDVRDVRQRLPAGALAFKDQTGTCSYCGLDTALANCTTYTEKAMQAINKYATTAKVKIVSNIYYPGYDADNVLTTCKDPATGAKINMQRPSSCPTWPRATGARATWRRQYGFKCADSFAEFMGADYDSNGDGQIDSRRPALRAGRERGRLRHRITSTLRRRCATPTRTSPTRAPATTTSSRTTRTPPTTSPPSLSIFTGTARARARRTSPTRRSSAARTRSGTSRATSTRAWILPRTTRPRRSRRSSHPGGGPSPRLEPLLPPPLPEGAGGESLIGCAPTCGREPPPSDDPVPLARSSPAPSHRAPPRGRLARPAGARRTCAAGLRAGAHPGALPG